MKALKPVVVLIAFLGAIHLMVSTIEPKKGATLSTDWQQALSHWYWVRSYDAWVARDTPRLIDEFSVATALYPENMEYWQLAASKIAFDFPVWEIEAQGIDGGSEMASIRLRFGEDALAFFLRSEPFFENESRWYLNAGFLAERACLDPERALSYFKEGVGLPDIPYPLGVNYTRLLIENGQPEAALRFLKGWYPAIQGSHFAERQIEIGDWISRLDAKTGIPDP